MLLVLCVIISWMTKIWHANCRRRSSGKEAEELARESNRYSYWALLHNKSIVLTLAVFKQRLNGECGFFESCMMVNYNFPTVYSNLLIIFIFIIVKLTRSLCEDSDQSSFPEYAILVVTRQWPANFINCSSASSRSECGVTTGMVAWTAMKFTGLSCSAPSIKFYPVNYTIANGNVFLQPKKESKKKSKTKEPGSKPRRASTIHFLTYYTQ